MTDGDDLAYPVIDSKEMVYQAGLTKREYFAAMAMQGLCVQAALDKEIQKQAEDVGSNSSIAIAIYAIDLADALIEQLNKTEKP